MNIREKLTLLFIAIVAVIISFSSILIYILSEDYREDDFYNRLSKKAYNVAKLLIEVDEVDLKLLAKIERDNPVSLPSEKITIYNDENIILYTSDSTRVIKVTDETLNEIRSGRIVKYRQGDYQVLGELFPAANSKSYVFIAAAIDEFGLKKISNLVSVLIASFFISIIIVSVAGWVFAGRALVPISKVIKEVDDITVLNLNKRVNEGNKKDEIARLAITFNQMLTRLEKAFKIQKQFIANASHELRTPLTSITGKLEVTLLQRRTIEKYEETLTHLLTEVKHVNTLANRLLILAQTSSDGIVIHNTQVRIDEILWLAKEELVASNSEYTVSIGFDLMIDDDRLTITGDEQLLRISFINLMDNACKYSLNKQSNVLISASAGSIIIHFKDSGLGISDEDINNIFEPFYRGKNSISERGHGIGLSLVKRIIELHKGTISLQTSEGVGTIFTITLPFQ